MKKSIFKSKTFWLNAIMGVVAVSTYINPELLGAIGVNEASQQKVLTLVGTVTAILNVILRMVTTEPVRVKKQKDA